MKRSKPTAPSYVDLVRQADSERPVLSWRERQAVRRLGPPRAKRDSNSGWDPLERRLGLQADLRQRRPYYAIWSPTYHELLRRHPHLDDSLPGPAWLRTVYTGSRRDSVVLPGVLAVLRLAASTEHSRTFWQRPPKPKTLPAPAPGTQGNLFAEAT